MLQFDSLRLLTSPLKTNGAAAALAQTESIPLCEHPQTIMGQYNLADVSKLCALKYEKPQMWQTKTSNDSQAGCYYS